MKIGSTFLVIAVLSNLLACGKSEDSPAKKPSVQPKEAQLAPAAINQVPSEAKTDETGSTKTNSTELTAPLAVADSEEKVETATSNGDEAEKKTSEDLCELSDYVESKAIQEPNVASPTQEKGVNDGESLVCPIAAESATQQASGI